MERVQDAWTGAELETTTAVIENRIQTERFTFSMDHALLSQEDVWTGDGEEVFDGVAGDPIQIPIFDNSDQRDLKEANCEVLREEIASFGIGFDLETFPEYIASWIPRLRHAALPGSYEQLLLLLFDDLNQYIRLQQSMTNGIPDYLGTHLDRILRADKRRNLGMSREWSRGPRNPARLRARSGPCAGGKRTDELFFLSELRMLRDLVVPLRDTTKPVYWITSRADRADEMEDQFAASMDMVNDFKEHLISSLYDHHKNYTIYSALSLTSHRHESLISLKQYRLDACRGTLFWEKYPPDEIQFQDFYQYYREHIIDTAPDTARQRGFLPPEDPPPPTAKVSYQPGTDLGEPYAPITDEGEVLTLLVRTVQWLALARGFPAVHLFCDISRLFTIYGVDVANATQVDFCNLLINMRLPRDNPGPPLPIPFPFTDTMHYERNPEYFRDVVHANRVLARVLIHEDTLLSRDDNAISWDYPHQTLAWVTRDDRRVLGLKEPFQRCKFRPWHVVDTEWEDFVAAHLEEEDIDRSEGGVLLANTPLLSQPTAALDVGPSITGWENRSKSLGHRRTVSTGSRGSVSSGTVTVGPATPEPPPRFDPVFSREELSAWLEAIRGSPRC